MTTTIRRTFARALALGIALIAGLTLFVVPTPKAEAMTNFGYKVSQVAASREGMPYVRGANGPTRFDCSGLTQWTFARLGKSLPRTSSAQYAAVKHIPREYRRKGDLVFFYGLGHAGIYLGRGRFVHAANARDDVTIDTLTGWYRDHYVGARRVA